MWWNKLNTCILSIVFSAVIGPLIIPVENARILAINSIAGVSHWNYMSAILRSLTEAGHHVTVFTQFPQGDRANYTEIDTSKYYEIYVTLDMITFIEQYSHPIQAIDMVKDFTSSNCALLYSIDRLNELIKNGNKNSERFDVILIEPFALDCMSYLANSLNIPIIYTISLPMITHFERLYLGQVSNPACVSNLFADYAVPKTFFQRFTNTALAVYGMFRTNWDDFTLKISEPKPYLLSPTVHPSMVFLNVHHITEASRPVPSNLVDIGGIHLHLKKTKSIPKDLLDFIEGSAHGVIYFTFGSTFKTSSIPEHIINVFKEALAQVPQRVLWKYDGEMKDKPKNVWTSEWFPQREILLHPKMKLFMSHGGMSGVYEAVDAGVPVLGFPVYYDQPRNIENLVHNGMAISMDLLSITNETVLRSVLEITNNKKYTQNAKIASERFKDRPMSPAQSVVYWTEYVIRHKGAPHLQSHSYNLTWYQYYLLDVISVVLILVSIVLLIVYKFFKMIYKCIPKNSNKNKTKSE